MFRWVVAPTDVFPQMAEKYTQAIFQMGRAVVRERAQAMEEWAKTNAPWTDRTGAARSGLHASVIEESGQIGTVVLAHGVDYGLWLEIANGGRYAIIAQAVDMFGPIIMGDLQQKLASGALPGFTFSSSAARFRSLSTGRFVSRRDIVSRLGI